MASTPGIGPSQAPLDYDGSRIAPEIRQGLAAQSPEIRAGVKAVADQPATPGRQDDRASWRQPGEQMKWQ
jgi:hypothetical protein